MLGLLWRVFKWVIIMVMCFGILSGLDYIMQTEKVWPLYLILLAIGVIMIAFKSTFDDNKKFLSVTAAVFVATGLFVKYGFVYVEPYVVQYADIFDVKEQLFFEGFYVTWIAWDLLIGIPIITYLFHND